MTRMQEVSCPSAGPLVSLTLCLLSRWMPILGLCALVQGLFNLLPVYPMDGGRILQAIAGERASNVIAFVTTLYLIGIGVYLTFYENMGLIPLLFALFLLIRFISAKYSLQS